MISEINSIMIPDIAPSRYNNININIFSLMFLLPLNNTIIAVPLPVSKPLINDDMLMALFKYNSVNITEAPQFGIRPIILVISGANIVSLRNSFDRKSSPIYVNSVFIIKFVANKNIVILNVCFRAGFNMPWSQWQLCSSHIW